MTSSAVVAVPSEAPSKGPVICVFCGVSAGTTDAHLKAARELAHVFRTHGVTLVYGGGSGGVMGEVAKTLVSLSGSSSVHGITPKALMKYERTGRDAGKPVVIDEATYGRSTVVQDMHARKTMMAQCVKEGGPGSGFVALSGGWGTMEELMEMVTWNQLGIQEAGSVVFNVEGFYDGLLTWANNAVKEGFISKGNREILVEALTAEEVVKALREYKISPDRLKLDWSGME